MPPPPDPASPSLNKRQRLDPLADPNASQQGQPISAPGEDAFITDQDAGDSGADDDEDEEKPKSDKKAGRRKIKIEFIQDKSRRHITFSKRKAGIMKKAYELSTLTGTQVLLLVVSETGLVYTFTTAKLQPLVTQPEGKNLIQACLNAPHGQLPSSMPVGTPIGRSSNPMNIPGSHAGGPANVPGGLSISGSAGSGKEEGENEEADGEQPGSATDRSASDGGNATGRKRRRASSTATNPNSSAQNQAGGPTTRAAAANNTAVPPSAPPPQGPTTSPHTRTAMPLPIPQSGPVAMSPTQGLPSPLDSHRQPPQSPNYTPYGAGDMYQPGQQAYAPPGPGGPPPSLRLPRTTYS
ncbi:hypothetical protein NLI96_g2270 [Meripilus lineatus]|uniref:MADS-box domain-containing protein n=1 Tax=Meripilus lineatus TaxID=2056292 RepID=A0AAD5YK45_9APHY|nr:hypothetical protein NLI96_g2270 [Physisporinus lineatus]